MRGWIDDRLPEKRGRVFIRFLDEHRRLRTATAFWNGRAFTTEAAPEGTQVLAWRPIPDEERKA